MMKSAPKRPPLEASLRTLKLRLRPDVVLQSPAHAAELYLSAMHLLGELKQDQVLLYEWRYVIISRSKGGSNREIRNRTVLIYSTQRHNILKFETSLPLTFCLFVVPSVVLKPVAITRARRNHARVLHPNRFPPLQPSFRMPSSFAPWFAVSKRLAATPRSFRMLLPRRESTTTIRWSANGRSP